jgi:hypothetical protein
MTRVIVDEVLRNKLHNLCQPLELCDGSGRVLGRFFPTLDLSQYEPLEPQISNEEMQRRKLNKGKTFTTVEVLAHLENL